MLDSVRVVLEQSPLLALFAVIGIGYAVGQISIAGFSLGVGAVLFAGLAVGAVAPNATPPGMVSSIGLAMFLYGVGIQYGRQFFAGLRGPGLKWNLIGVIGVVVALAISLALGGAFGVSPAHAIGLFAGSMTCTPALQAAIDAAGNRDPAIGYSIAYPLGVVGPILCLYAFSRMYRPRISAAPAPPQPLEVTLDGAGLASVAEVTARLPPGVDLVAIRQGNTNSLPDPYVRLADGDAVMLFGPPDALEEARLALGRVDPGRLASDRGELDVGRVFASRAEVVGTPLGRFHFPAGIIAKIAEVRRGDTVLLPRPELVLEYGDRVTFLASREAIPAVRQYFGDSLKSTAEFSYVSVGLGMSLGVLLGLVRIPIPGAGAFSLGLAGGPLIVSLVLGRLGRSGSLSWHLPLAANLTLRNFGLTLFLAAVGIGSGAPFVQTLSTTGVSFLVMAAAIVLGAFLAVIFVAHYVFKMPTDDLFGVVSGTGGNPAIVAYANKAVQSDGIDVAFATIYPSMTILKIICAQVALGLLGGT
jgi:putative transport protein